MRVLVACEYSGIVRDAFIRAGHDAISCDLLPSESDFGPHIEGDIFKVDMSGFDLMVAHPPCTYLTNAGARWLHEETGRWEYMEEGADFFRYFIEAPVPRICIENPIMHGHGKSIIGVSQAQTIQPWQFGHGEQKAICLWLKALPPLHPTNIVEGREQRVHSMAPGPDRQRERSRFFMGVADAMAAQWSDIRQGDWVHALEASHTSTD